MSVDHARREYEAWGRVLRGNAADHAGWLSYLSRDACATCAYASLQTDAASIDLDMATTASVAGPRPMWLWPSWLFGQASA